MAYVRWLPTVVHDDCVWVLHQSRTERIGDSMYVAIRQSDHDFIRFCGEVDGEPALPRSWFIGEIRDRRNESVRHAIEDVMRRRANGGRIGDVARDGDRIEDDALPRTVQVMMPAINKNDERADACTMNVVLQRNPQRSVAIEITDENFSYVRAAVRATVNDAAAGVDMADSDDDANTRKRVTGHAGVYYNRQRKALIYRFKDAGSNRKTKSLKIAHDDDIRLKAAELVASARMGDASLHSSS